MQLFHIPQSTIPERNVHISVLNGNCGICNRWIWGIVSLDYFTDTMIGSNTIGERNGQEMKGHLTSPFSRQITTSYDVVVKWPRYWPFVRGIHRPPVNSPHKGQWRGALMFSLNCALNKRLSKQSWFETPSRSLWRYCNDGMDRLWLTHCEARYWWITRKSLSHSITHYFFHMWYYNHVWGNSLSNE